MATRAGTAHCSRPINQWQRPEQRTGARAPLPPVPDLVEDADPGTLPWGLGTVPEGGATDPRAPSLPRRAWLPEHPFRSQGCWDHMLLVCNLTNDGGLGTA